MKRISKIFFCALAAVSLGLTACDSSGNSETETTTTAAATTTAAETTAATTTQAETTTEATTEAPAEFEIDPSKPVVALTFDDGPNDTVSPQILDSLEERGIVATYFLIGGNINDSSAEHMKRAYELGCEFGNHSWTYNSMHEMTAEQVEKSLNDTGDKIVEVIGTEDARPKYYRAPNLAVNPALTEIITNLGYPFMEGITGNDWSEITPQQIYDGVVPRVTDGSIILLHDGASNQRTADAIEMILDELIAQDYQFLTLTQLFEYKGVTPEPGVKYGMVQAAE